MRSRAESTGGCVKLKTVTEIRRSSACDAESVYLVLNSLLDWKLVEKTETGVMWSVLRFFNMKRAAQFCMQQRLWTEEAERSERRELQ